MTSRSEGGPKANERQKRSGLAAAVGLEDGAVKSLACAGCDSSHAADLLLLPLLVAANQSLLFRQTTAACYYRSNNCRNEIEAAQTTAHAIAASISRLDVHSTAQASLRRRSRAQNTHAPRNELLHPVAKLEKCSFIAQAQAEWLQPSENTTRSEAETT